MITPSTSKEVKPEIGREQHPLLFGVGAFQRFLGAFQAGPAAQCEHASLGVGKLRGAIANLELEEMRLDST